MWCVPGVSDEVAKLAVPARVSGALVTGLPSTVNATVPEGPVGGDTLGGTGLTVAVNVTDWPKVDGLCDELSTVLVPALSTTCASGGEVLAPNEPSPG